MQATEVLSRWQRTITQHNLLSTATEQERRDFIKRNLDAYNRTVADFEDEQHEVGQNRQ